MRPFCLALLVVFVAACDSGSDSDPGRFEATFTGDVSATLRGDAAIQRLTFPDATGELSVTMVPDGALSDPTAVRSLSLGGLDEVTGTGTYSLDADGARSLSLVYLGFGNGPTLSARSGTVTLTRFEDDRVEGTFEAEMEETFGGDGAEARVEGTFSARPLSFR